MDFATIIQMLDSTVRLATPLLLACLAGLFSERAGIFDIGLEGKMLVSAFASAAFAVMSGSVWIGLMAGIAASMLLAVIHGVASITFRGNQLISGVALNFLASGLTVLLSQSWFGLGGRTPSLEGGARFSEITLPFAVALKDVPIFGPIYHDLISGHTILVYVALALVPASAWLLYSTRFGLRLRAVGENPAAVDTAGVSVVAIRFAAVLIAGVLCGLAGAYLASLAAQFGREMTAGRGYIALAALIFAKWRPWYALMACLLFGFLDAVAIRYQNLDLGIMDFVVVIFAVAAGRLLWSLRKTPEFFWNGAAMAVSIFASLLVLRYMVSLMLFWRVTVPVQFTQALPYILTVVILAGFVGKAIPPRAGGEPYVKER